MYKKTWTKKPVAPHVPKEINIVPSMQQEAIGTFVAEGEGNGCFLARAGTAKTTTSVWSMRYAKGSILYLCFGKANAIEAKDKVPLGVEAKTFHSMGCQILFNAYGRIQFAKGKDEKTKLILSKMDVPDKSIPQFCKCVSLCKNTISLDIEAITKTAMEYDCLYDSDELSSSEFIITVEKVLQESLKMTNLVDFDDMLYIPVVNNLRFPTYDNIYGDEAQDFNEVQMEMIIRFAGSKGRIFIVGDDKQSIYEFRGATKNAINILADKINAVRFPLTITYRCPKAVVRLAQSEVPDYMASPNNIEGEINQIEINDLESFVKEGDIIISRKNAPIIALSYKFIAERKRVKVLGKDFGDALISIVKRFKGNSLEDFNIYLGTWAAKQMDLLESKFGDKANFSGINDKIDCLKIFIAESKTIDELITTINGLFSDRRDDNCITMSTTHKAKGLEYDNVFVLSSTFSKQGEEQERNLWYVAITRTKKVLNLVNGLPNAKKGFIENVE